MHSTFYVVKEYRRQKNEENVEMCENIECTETPVRISITRIKYKGLESLYTYSLFGVIVIFCYKCDISWGCLLPTTGPFLSRWD